jgi:hypothetical protein
MEVSQGSLWKEGDREEAISWKGKDTITLKNLSAFPKLTPSSLLRGRKGPYKQISLHRGGFKERGSRKICLDPSNSNDSTTLSHLGT